MDLPPPPSPPFEQVKERTQEGGKMNEGEDRKSRDSSSFRAVRRGWSQGERKRKRESDEGGSGGGRRRRERDPRKRKKRKKERKVCFCLLLPLLPLPTFLASSYFWRELNLFLFFSPSLSSLLSSPSSSSSPFLPPRPFSGVNKAVAPLPSSSFGGYAPSPLLSRRRRRGRTKEEGKSREREEKSWGLKGGGGGREGEGASGAPKWGGGRDSFLISPPLSSPLRPNPTPLPLVADCERPPHYRLFLLFLGDRSLGHGHAERISSNASSPGWRGEACKMQKANVCLDGRPSIFRFFLCDGAQKHFFCAHPEEFPLAPRITFTHTASP